MFERFTDRSRRIVVLSQEEARNSYRYVTGTEHILLGILHEGEGVGCKTLESFGITLENARAKIEEISGAAPDKGREQVPFSPRSKRTLELSVREANQLDHSYVSTEHVLLALVHDAQIAKERNANQSERGDITEDVLQAFGVELDHIRPRMQELFPDVFETSQELPKNRPPSTSSHQPTSVVIPRASRADVKALVDEAIAKLGEASELLGQDVSFDSITALLEGASYSAHGAASLTKWREWFPPLTAPLMPPLPPQDQGR